jgi:subtilase family serine protease
MLQRCRYATLCSVLPMLLLALNLGRAQFRPEPTRRLITQTVDDSKRVRLLGNVRPEVNSKNDRGSVPDSLPMEHLQLILRLPEEKEQELERYLREVQDPQSSTYHKWLTSQQFKEEFSLSPEDIQIITNWLRSDGFQVNVISPTSIDFSGTAGQVEHAFQTEIHYLDVRGVKHIANITDPEIPAALAPAVSGIVSLNDFRPRPQ